jgi:hexosaminidase
MSDRFNSRLGVYLCALLGGLTVVTLSMRQMGGGAIQTLPLVPLPAHIEQRHGHFLMDARTRLLVDDAARGTGEYLADRLRKSTGYPLPISASATSPAAGCILLTTNQASASLGTEGYTLSITPDAVVLRAPNAAGLFYGVQTLLQLFPPEVFASAATNAAWRAPCLQIDDQPRFHWRGLMLDVSRHFFTKTEVEQVLDGMALHKLNMFHWHLTDDQGWRIQIKKYPRLTEVGAWRKRIGFNLDPKSSTAYGPDGRYGGFYTQDDIREVVAYAAARHITVVPEIEMPGHSSAALAAYPELSCSGGPYSTDSADDASAGVYCAGKEQTFEFLENVLTEVMALFPGPYIHIGGDEVPKLNWHDCPLCRARMQHEGLPNERELEAYFVRRINTFLQAHGRTLLGWSELGQSQNGLPENAMLMDWIGGARAAANAGHDVVRCPNDSCYFDLYQSRDRAHEPAAAGGDLPLSKVYAFEPIPHGLDSASRHRIVGAQANLWTEYMPSLASVQYMEFPRICALAEVVWSPEPLRNWQSFWTRLQVHLQRLDLLGIKHRRLGTPYEESIG